MNDDPTKNQLKPFNMKKKVQDDNGPVVFNWKRNHLFDKFLVEILYNNCLVGSNNGRV